MTNLYLNMLFFCFYRCINAHHGALYMTYIPKYRVVINCRYIGVDEKSRLVENEVVPVLTDRYYRVAHLPCPRVHNLANVKRVVRGLKYVGLERQSGSRTES